MHQDGAKKFWSSKNYFSRRIETTQFLFSIILLHHIFGLQLFGRSNARVSEGMWLCIDHREQPCYLVGPSGATVGIAEGAALEHRTKHDAHDGAQLDQDVEGGARSVLQWVSDGVTGDGVLVRG